MTLKENVILSDIKKNYKLDNLIEKLDESGFDYKKDTINSNFELMLSKEFNGIDLSGGEWQRLAIARGIYRSHNVIILDEPTAAIDPIEEANVYEKFKKIAKGKTVIVVTHRLGSVKDADRVIVMKNGKIIEDGMHEGLINQNGYYSQMYNEQAQWYHR